MVKRTKRVNVTTLIIVGEGPHDAAFLNHMKGLYDGRFTNQKVTIDAADGGSPTDILESVIKRRHIAFDQRYVLMDADIPIDNKVYNLAKRNKITILVSCPICLEGMLLDVLRKSYPPTSRACKSQLQGLLRGPPTEKASYSLFTRELLDSTTKSTIRDLRNLLSNRKLTGD